MDSKIFKNIKPANMKERKSKGFNQKTVDLLSTNKKPISLKDIKEMGKVFDKESKKKDGKFIIRGRNKYRENITIMSYDGTYYDEDDDYYNARGYEKETFDNFDMIQIVYIN